MTNSSNSQDRKQGTVYVLRAGNTDRYKIGYTSRDVASRAADLQTGCPFDISIVHEFAGSIEDEQSIHSILGGFRKTGEWFELSNQDLFRLLIGFARQESGSLYIEPPTMPGKASGGEVVFVVKTTAEEMLIQKLGYRSMRFPHKRATSKAREINPNDRLIFLEGPEMLGDPYMSAKGAIQSLLGLAWLDSNAVQFRLKVNKGEPTSIEGILHKDGRVLLDKMLEAAQADFASKNEDK